MRSIFAFDLPRAERVRLAVYDLQGRRVRVLEDRVLEPGRHERIWDGSDGSGAPARAGIYFVRLETSSAMLQRKAVLTR